VITARNNTSDSSAHEGAETEKEERIQELHRRDAVKCN